MLSQTGILMGGWGHLKDMLYSSRGHAEVWSSLGAEVCTESLCVENSVILRSTRKLLGMFLILIVVTASWVYMYAQMPQIVPFKWVQFTPQQS